jgi:acyl-CoA thioester hydrolase
MMGTFLPRKARIEVEVPFHHCDPLAVVWHGHYFEYMEAARRSLLSSFRLSVEDMIALKLRMFIVDAKCRYNFPLRYGDRGAVTAGLKVESPLLRVAYQIRNITQDRLSARAHTLLAFTDEEGSVLPEIPEVVLSRLDSEFVQ